MSTLIRIILAGALLVFLGSWIGFSLAYPFLNWLYYTGRLHARKPSIQVEEDEL